MRGQAQEHINEPGGLTATWWLRTLLALTMLLAMTHGLASAEDDASGDPPAADVSEPAEPVVQVTDVPPEPTPTPTETPLPPDPTPTAGATDVPTEIPTDEPVTETATPEETATEEIETPTPSPTPTQEPPAPFEPLLECERPEGADIAVAGESEWALLTCSVRWETEAVNEVTALARPAETGWSVVLVDEETIRQELPLDNEDDRLDLADADSDDDEFLTTRFVLATRVGCAVPMETAIDLELTATSAPDVESESVTEETVTRRVEVAARQPSAPSLAGLSVSFDPIANSLEGSRTSAGLVTFSFVDAPERCGWQASIYFDDFVAGDYVIPAAHLVAMSASGADGLQVTSESGAITVRVPESETPRDADGAITIGTELDLGTFMPRGTYQSTITVELALLQ